MATDVGIKLKIEGEKEYKQSLKDIITSQKEWQSEIKAVDSALESEMSAEDKAVRKKELLSKSIEDQEKKLGLMKGQLEKVEDAYGKDSKEAKQMRTNINNATTALNKMRGDAQKLTPKLKSIGDTMEKAGKKIQKAGDNITKYVSAPLTGLAAASVAAFNEVDEGMDVVVKKTGATGEALESLQQSAKNIATTIPTSFADAGSAIGEVNTKFGLTGEELETLSGKFIKFAELNDTDVSGAVDKTQKVMQAFGVRTEDAGKLLDAMNATGQNTGISMDTLSTTMVKNAAALRDMGLDAYDAAQFLGSVEMSGANTADVMKGMQKAMTEAAEDGMTLPEKLQEFNGVMQSSMSDADKLTYTMETFGTKAGQAIYNAYQEGSLSFESLYRDADTYLGNIETTFDNTLDAPDRMQVALNKVKTAGSEIGEVLLQMAVPAIESVAGKVEWLGKWFDSLDESGQTAVGNVVAALIVGGPALHVAGGLVGAVGQVTTAISGAGGLIPAISSVGSAAGGIVSAAGPVLGVGALIGGLALSIKLATAGIESGNETIKKQAETQQKNAEALQEAMSAIDEAISSGNQEIEDINSQAEMALGLADELEALAGQAHKTVAEEARMQSIVDQLNSLYPDLNVSIDKNTGKLSKNTGQIKDYIKEARKIALLDAYTRASAKATDALVEANNRLYNAQKDQSEAQKTLKYTTMAWTEAKAQFDEQNKNGYYDEALKEQVDTLYADMLQARENVDGYKASVADAQAKVDEATTATAGWAEQIDILTGSTDKNTEATRQNASGNKDEAGSLIDVSKALKEKQEAVGQQAATAMNAFREEINKWNELYNATKESIEGQIGLFDEWEKDAEVTKESILANLQSQVDGLTGYASNIEKLTKYAEESGDENIKAFVKNIGEMGLSASNEVAALVDALDNDKDTFNAILGAFVASEGIISDQIAPELTYLENDFKAGAKTAVDAFNEAFASEDFQSLKDMYETGQETATTALNGFIEHLKGTGEKVEPMVLDPFDDVIVGIANKEEDMQEAVETVALDPFDDVIVGIANVEPEVKDAASGAVDSIGEAWDEEGVSVLERIAATEEKYYGAGADAVGAIAEGAESQKSAVKTAASDAADPISGISGDIDKSAKDIKSSANQSILGMIGGMILNKLLLASTATGIAGTIGNISTVIDGKKAYLKQSGQGAVDSVKTGMTDEKPKLRKAVGETTDVVTDGAKTIKDLYNDYLASGQQVVKGLTTGMDWEAQNAYRKAAAIASIIKSTINNALKIQSPSKVMMETGRYVSEGLAIGMEQQLPEVEKASVMLGRAAVPFGATGSDVLQIRAEAYGGLDVDAIYAAVRSGAADGQQPVIISEKSFKRALVGMGVQVA